MCAVDFSNGTRVRAIGSTGGEDVEPADLYVLEDGRRVIPFRLDGLTEIGRAVDEDCSIRGWLVSVSLAQVGGIGDDLSLLPSHTFHATVGYDEKAFAGGPHSYDFSSAEEYDAVVADIRNAMPVLLYHQRKWRAVDKSRYRPTLCVEIECPPAAFSGQRRTGNLRVVGGTAALTQKQADRALALAQSFTDSRVNVAAMADSLSLLPLDPLWSERVFSEILRAGVDPLSVYRCAPSTPFFLKGSVLEIVLNALRARAQGEQAAFENLIKFVDFLSRAEVAYSDNRKRTDLNLPLVLTPRPPRVWNVVTPPATPTHDISQSGH